jgi:hypothetical protein
MVLNADAGSDFAASWPVPLPIRLWRFGGLVHTTGLDARWPFQALQPGDLGSLLTNQLLEGGNLAQQHRHQLPQSSVHDLNPVHYQ